MFRTILLFSAFLAMPAFADPSFQSGRPVWPEGREREMNLTAGFRAVFAAPAGAPVHLKIAASTLYRACVNGRFLFWGPARGPHGFYRVDELDITRHLVPGRNIVAIEVAGYNINSYWTLNQPSFLQAEVVEGAKVLASTAGAGALFEAAELGDRTQKVQRYSFQRAFTEVYRLRPDSTLWRSDPDARFSAVLLAVTARKALIARGVPYPDFAVRQPVRVVSRGGLRTNSLVKLWRDRTVTAIGPELLGFRESELETVPAVRVQQLENIRVEALNRPFDLDETIQLAANRFELFDFGTNLSGFIGARVTVRQAAKLCLTFDEMLTKGDVDFTRLAAASLIVWELQPGVYDIESFEPYTLRFLKVMALEGECDISRVWLREYANPDVWRAQFASSDPGLNKLFAAGRETYRQNAVDLYTDCPHRERAGWLCDSYFTARVEPLLSGHSKVEQAFLENYQLPPSFEKLPEGMLPMCYPADHYNGQFIPNFTLWFVLQLEEYVDRTGDRAMADAMRPRVMKVFDYFKGFRNSDGLLEGLEKWVFIEWSATNKFVQDVNYPVNMLYAAALASAGRIYGTPQLAREAESVRKTIREQSFDGEFFVDNALRRGGKLAPTRNRTETCQYYAFYFGTATPEGYPQLWKTLSESFGPQRKAKGLFPEIHESNALNGNLLRLELLSRAGRTRQLIGESRAYLLYMAESTGTLWENQEAGASLNHAFASHIVNLLYRDALGLSRVHMPSKTVEVRFTGPGLDWCEGSIPVDGGMVSLRWRLENGTIGYQLDAPAGYRVKIENSSGFALKQLPAADEARRDQ